jgi:formate dehydrogenase subunit gamma
VRAEPAAIEHCVKAAVSKLAGQAGPLLEILHEVQNELGCVPPEAVPLIADALNLSRAEVHGVVSFYHHFREKPVGRLHVQLCRAEACQSMDGEGNAHLLRQRLGVDFGQTRADGAVTLDSVYCLGLCACAPAALVNGHPEGRFNAQAIDFFAKKYGVY